MAYAYYNYGPQQIYAQQPIMGQGQAPNGYMPLYAPAAPNSYAPATPYGPVQPALQPQAPFIPPHETPPAQSQPLQNKSRPKHSYRAATTPLPLKSALKKSGAAGAAPVQAALPEGSQPRRRINSRVKHDKHTALAPPDQTIESSDKGEAFHLFVTFKGDSELLLENTLDNARQEIEREIFPLWPHGVETQVRGADWIVRFRNAPWNMSGPDVHIAWKLITALFTLFAVRGFSFMTSTRCTTTQPRLVFQSTAANKDSAFFLGYLSRGGRRFSLINPPPHIAVSFGPKLRAFLPGQIEVSEENDILIVETKREIGGAGVKPARFLMQILRALMGMEFNLNATVPMARGGPLGMGSRRELLVFKRVPPGFLS